MDITRPVYLEINLNNLQYNIEQIQNKVGKNVKLMPVIKASGYGTNLALLCIMYIQWVNSQIK